MRAFVVRADAQGQPLCPPRIDKEGSRLYHVGTPLINVKMKLEDYSRCGETENDREK
jgi:hypothetical protein